jgi:5-formyltetrahydrofolate cyclo-ligase
MSSDSLLTRQQFRRHALQQRRQLTYFQQQSAGKALCRRMQGFPPYRQARFICVYLSVASEISTAALLRMANRDGKRCFVPVLHPWQPRKMVFVLYKAGERLRRNRWGIAEPALGLQNRLTADKFDLVMMPLLAFDQQGRRLGMGQGFYDRAFAFRRVTRCKPLLLGLAHECQQTLLPLPAQPWDVDMDAVATPKRITFFR